MKQIINFLIKFYNRFIEKSFFNENDVDINAPVIINGEPGKIDISYRYDYDTDGEIRIAFLREHQTVKELLEAIREVKDEDIADVVLCLNNKENIGFCFDEDDNEIRYYLDHPDETIDGVLTFISNHFELKKVIVTEKEESVEF